MSAKDTFLQQLLSMSHDIQYVRMSERNYRKLVELIGSESLVKRYVIDIDDYCASTGKRYKDYAATVRVWWRRDRVRDAQRQVQAIERAREARKPRRRQVLASGDANVNDKQRWLRAQIKSLSDDLGPGKK